ncbi:MAG: hypothetical protein ACRDRV_11205 [Pseudonocardiaceae bacterium]
MSSITPPSDCSAGGMRELSDTEPPGAGPSRQPSGRPEFSAGDGAVAAWGCGASRTGARRTGSSAKVDPQSGLAPGVHGAAWPGARAAGAEVRALLSGALDLDVTLLSLTAGSAAGATSFSDPNGDPPCTTAAVNITAEPANRAPRARDVGRHELGEADE